MAAKDRITVERLRELLHYDPETGVFTRRVSRSGMRQGRVGSPDSFGYLLVCVDYRKYRAHHLAWLYVYGRLPSSSLVIDHIDGDKLNNRIANLREVAHHQNSQNRRKARLGSTSGLLGVSYSSRTDSFRMEIMAQGSRLCVSGFDCALHAHYEYLWFKQWLHGPRSTGPA